MKCYLCDNEGTTYEHAPARSFFPKGKRVNLITVRSCELHNTATSLDDEYIRNVIASAKGTNEVASNLFKHKGFRSMEYSSKLSNLMTKNPKRLNFIKGDEATKNLSFEIDRPRFDRALRKIAYALYFHKYKSTWAAELVIATEHLITDEYNTDEIAEEIKRHPVLQDSDNYEGMNPDVFKFSFLESANHPQKFLLMKFYEFFEVWAIPSGKSDTPLIY